MTNQPNPSPFSTDTKTGTIPSAPNTPVKSDYSIRTMQEDLAAIQNGGYIEEKNIRPNPSESPATPQAQTPSEPKVTPQTSSQVVQAMPTNITEVLPEEKTSENNPSSKPASIKIVMSIIVILVIMILGLGAYYFLLTKKTETPAIVTPPIETPLPVQEPVKEEVPVTVTPPAPKYTQEKPNFFPIDLTAMGAEEIKTSLVNLSLEIKKEQMGSLFEFVVVDKNNNPVVFPIFATATKINLSQATLNSLGGNFSIYFYKDNANVRTAISAQASNVALLRKELSKQEKTLLTDASFLFLDNSPETIAGQFATSKYKLYNIRFQNTNAAKDLSIDYTVTDAQLIIGSSKNTVRAVIDKIEKEIPTNQVGIDKSVQSKAVSSEASSATTLETKNDVSIPKTTTAIIK